MGRPKSANGDYAKEGLADQYFPEPDLNPLVCSRAYVANVRKEMPELPNEIRDRYKALGLLNGTYKFSWRMKLGSLLYLGFLSAE